MTLSDQFDDDVVDVLINSDEFAQTITRYALGSVGSPSSVTAVVELSARSVERERGKGFIVRGNVHVAATQTVDPRDGWLIGGKRFETEAIDEPISGKVVIHVVRYEVERDSPAGRSTR